MAREASYTPQENSGVHDGSIDAAQRTMTVQRLQELEALESSILDAVPQAILGLHSGEGSAYPTLQRVGRKIRFSLGTGSAWHTPYESGNVLTGNQWNHVALTLDKAENGGTLRLYINARLVDTKPFAVTDIAPTNSFWIAS